MCPFICKGHLVKMSDWRIITITIEGRHLTIPFEFHNNDEYTKNEWVNAILQGIETFMDTDDERQVSRGTSSPTIEVPVQQILVQLRGERNPELAIPHWFFDRTVVRYGDILAIHITEYRTLQEVKKAKGKAERRVARAERVVHTAEQRYILAQATRNREIRESRRLKDFQTSSERRDPEYAESWMMGGRRRRGRV